jgi:hypothetical protein
MNHLYSNSPTLSHLREWLLWVWLVGLLLVLIGAVVLFARTFVPPPTTLVLGQYTDFPPGKPVLVQPRRDLRVFVVRIEDEVYVWDRLPALSSACAPLVWVGHEYRFVDPCSAGKWCADGTIADPRIPGIRTLTGYRAHIDSAGQVSITLNDRVGGHPPSDGLAVRHDLSSLPPDEIYYCRHLW